MLKSIVVCWSGYLIISFLANRKAKKEIDILLKKKSFLGRLKDRLSRDGGIKRHARRSGGARRSSLQV